MITRGCRAPTQHILGRISPELAKLGWENIRFASNPASSVDRAIAECADVLVTSTTIKWLWPALVGNARPHQKLVLIEQFGAATLAPEPGGLAQRGAWSTRTRRAPLLDVISFTLRQLAHVALVLQSLTLSSSAATLWWWSSM